ncbi:hypothetical protein [Solimicrobium silvestre]|uniref:Putative membrane protein n=1 Tax=Solimicrobium silvestre TaxID=2099400 RepID=A0A2S9H5B2_9BURK|nr:putative membrane protein [Solimicrobium silvestre]
MLAAATRLSSFKISKLARYSVAVVILLAGIAVWWNALLPLKLYPVLVNAVLLATFSYSLVFPPSMVEFFARMSEPDLPLVAVAYTRRVTQIWCVFFIVNGAIALVTAIWASEAIWSLYTGVISYGLMGVLFGGEFLYRLRFKRLNHV